MSLRTQLVRIINLSVLEHWNLVRNPNILASASDSQDNQNRNRGGRGGGFRHQQPRFRHSAPRFGGPAAPWSRPGGRGGLMNFPRPYGGGPQAHGRGGGYGSRPFNHGRRGRRV